MTTPSGDLWTLEQAEDEIAEIRGQVDLMSEIVTTSDVQTATLEATGAASVGGTLAVTGAVTATGGTQAVPTLLHTDTWQSLGSSGLAGASGTARYRLTIENELQISIHLSFTAGPTSATFANALPAGYIPPANNTLGGNPFSSNAGAPVAGMRMAVNSGTGVVQLLNIPGAASAVGIDVKIPLD